MAPAASGARAEAERLVREGGALEFPRHPRGTERPTISAAQRRRALAKYTRAIALDPAFGCLPAPRPHAAQGTALTALGRYAAAEKEYRLAARPGGTNGELASHGVVESKIYQRDLPGALRELDRLAHNMDASDVATTRVYIHALMPQSPAPTPDAVRRAADPSIGGHNGFMNAVVLLRAGRADLARPRLRRFIDRCESNPSEWGVTRGWEIAKAKELLRGPPRLSR